LEEGIETSGQYDLRFTGDEVPKEYEAHNEYFKRVAVKPVKHAARRREKDVDDAQLFVEEGFTVDTNVPSACQSQS
jgi:hypothetical protein